jgi:hypothetical protein
MKPSTSLGIKSLAYKIHPPLPLTPRESQKLLTQLTGSFQQQLDQEHPPWNSSTKIQPTDAHISAILASPLLRRPSSTSKKQPRGTDYVSGVGKAQNLLQDPLEHLSTQIAAGQATISSATYCLETHQKNLETFGSHSTIRKLFGEREPATVVLNWLWASGLDESMEFVHNTDFLRSLIPSMIAENKVAKVWTWFARLQGSLTPTSPTDDEESVTAMGTLLKLLFWARIKHQQSFDGALKDFAQSITLLDSTNEQTIQEVLRPAVGMLSRHLLQHPTTAFDPSLYAFVLDNVLQWRPAVAKNTIIAARLALFGARPTASLAVQYLKNKETRYTPAPVVLESLMGIQASKVAAETKDNPSAKWLAVYKERHHAGNDTRWSRSTSVSEEVPVREHDMCLLPA